MRIEKVGREFEYFVSDYKESVENNGETNLVIIRETRTKRERKKKNDDKLMMIPHYRLFEESHCNRSQGM